MAFRNIHFNNKLGAIQLWTWDATGKRIEVVSSFEPYLYLESNNHQDAKSIYHQNLKKLSFKNNYERNKFVKESDITRVYHNLPPEQQFLLDTYKDGISADFPLKIFFFDIETYSKDRKFSTPEEATDPINLITIFDSLSQKFYTWGLKKNFSTITEDVVYVKCSDEEELLELFIKFWKKDYPDIVTGWNSNGYDIPYIINRVTKLLGVDEARKLSPVNKIWLKENASVNLKGQKQDRWLIYGVSHLDYMDVYKTFALGDRESYSLNYISDYELGETKVAYNTVSLSDLADTDWTTFVDYNIQDVRLLIKLEEKLKYLKLIQNLAYKGFVSFEKAMGKVQLITGAVAHQAMIDGMVIPTFNIENHKKDFAGGYVLEPVTGLYENIVSFDANSLYPSVMLTLNISPETKIGKVTKIDYEGYHLILTNQKKIVLTEEKFKKMIETENMSYSKAGILYSQKFKGIIPKFIDNLYTQRIDAKNEMIKFQKLQAQETDQLKKEQYEERITDNQTLSEVYKVVLNSCYGIFSQIYSPLFDIDHAESITLTGQETVKRGARILHEKALSNGISCSFEDICKYSDTDSVMIDISKILEYCKIPLHTNNEVTKKAHKIIDHYGDYINSEIRKWAISELNSADPRFVFKREKICDVAVLQKKKFYILHILDNEGVPCNKFVYRGIEVAKSIMSKDVKTLIKSNLEISILTRDIKQARKLFYEAYDTFCSMNEDQIAFRKKVNDYDKGERGYIDGQFAKGTPYHTKAAINYNKLLEKLGVDNKYMKIGNGNKFKFFYCLKNLYSYKTVGFLNEYPTEFKGVIEPDRKMMFEKVVAPVLNRVYSAIGWPKFVAGKQTVTDLTELFS
jgi:DNA polymerase elongation subunit (family B)